MIGTKHVERQFAALVTVRSVIYFFVTCFLIYELNYPWLMVAYFFLASSMLGDEEEEEVEKDKEFNFHDDVIERIKLYSISSDKDKSDYYSQLFMTGEFFNFYDDVLEVESNIVPVSEIVYAGTEVNIWDLKEWFESFSDEYELNINVSEINQFYNSIFSSVSNSKVFFDYVNFISDSISTDINQLPYYVGEWGKMDKYNIVTELEKVREKYSLTSTLLHLNRLRVDRKSALLEKRGKDFIMIQTFVEKGFYSDKHYDFLWNHKWSFKDTYCIFKHNSIKLSNLLYGVKKLDRRKLIKSAHCLYDVDLLSEYYSIIEQKFYFYNINDSKITKKIYAGKSKRAYSKYIKSPYLNLCFIKLPWQCSKKALIRRF